MHLTLLVAALVAAPAASAMAQPISPPAAAQSFSVPRAYASYSQPEITQCKTVNPGRRECTIPSMVAGRYLVAAGGIATASGAGSTQALAITLGNRPCIKTPKAPFTGKANLQLVCQISVLTDGPIVVAATYSAESATLDPAGPQLVVRRLPWDGVLEAHGAVVRPRAPGAPGAQQAPKPGTPPTKK